MWYDVLKIIALHKWKNLYSLKRYLFEYFKSWFVNLANLTRYVLQKIKIKSFTWLDILKMIKLHTFKKLHSF